MLSGGVPMEMIAQRMFQAGMSSLNRTMVQMATGLRINRAADDPAGLIASESLRSTLASLDAETRALSRADAVLSTADAALAEMSDLLGEAETLAVAAANTGASTPEERAAMQREVDSILQSVDRVARTSGFAGRAMFDGRMTVSVGQDSITLGEMSAGALGADAVRSGGASSLESGDPAAAADALRAARQQVAEARASIGSFQKDAIAPRVRAIDIASENTAAAVSLIRDTDDASAASQFARQRVLTAAAGRMLRLAGEQNAAVMGLLGER